MTQQWHYHDDAQQMKVSKLKILESAKANMLGYWLECSEIYGMVDDTCSTVCSFLPAFDTST